MTLLYIAYPPCWCWSFCHFKLGCLFFQINQENAQRIALNCFGRINLGSICIGWCGQTIILITATCQGYFNFGHSTIQVKFNLG